MPATAAARTLADDLLLQALAEPAAAEVRATELLSSTTDRWLQSVARHARGLALRERGDVKGAVPELRNALRLAAATGDPDREADVRATLGVALAMAGRTDPGLTQLDRAVDDARDPAVAARVLMRRGYVLSSIVGRHDDALTDYERALAGARLAGDRIWEARTLNNIACLHLLLGHVDAAGTSAVEAERILTQEGRATEAAQALHNQGGVAYIRGDLPTSLRLYDEAAARFAALDLDGFELAADWAETLLAAGLATEAADVAEARLARGGLAPIRAADLHRWRAEALLAAGQPGASLVAGRLARDAYRRHGRDWFALRAELTVLRAREAGGRPGRGAGTAAVSVAHRLEADGADEAAQAWLLAARLAPAESAYALRHGAGHRTHRLPMVRATGWLARGLERELAGDRRGVLLACRRGLDALDAHRATLGSSELRALATGYGADLAALALTHAVEAPARTFLWWSERWRATALAEPPVRPEDETSAPMAALRDNGRRLQVAHREGADTGRLEAERARLEEQVRRLGHHASGSGSTAAAPRPGVDRLVEATGDAAFVELVEVGSGVVAVVVRGGRVRRFEVGPVEAAVAAVTYTHFVLRQAARGRPAQVGPAGERLQRALLGPAAGSLGDGPVVVSPTSRFHAVPWGLLPVLADRPVTTAPSAALWLRARSATAPEAGGTVLVVGPGLASGGAEVPVLARQTPGAVLLSGGEATADATLTALDGAKLAHLAAHGHFRQDSPMFSSVVLDDGPLVVHDFERLHRAPHRVVLSACESGVMKPVGAGELLGLGAALLSLGTAGVVSSVAVVNDEATVDVMVALHAQLRAGAGLADALLAARRATAHDATLSATAASFTAMGV